MHCKHKPDEKCGFCLHRFDEHCECCGNCSACPEPEMDECEGFAHSDIESREIDALRRKANLSREDLAELEKFIDNLPKKN